MGLKYLRYLSCVLSTHKTATQSNMYLWLTVKKLYKRYAKIWDHSKFRTTVRKGKTNRKEIIVKIFLVYSKHLMENHDIYQVYFRVTTLMDSHFKTSDLYAVITVM